jgi:hypothetical protein
LSDQSSPRASGWLTWRKNARAWAFAAVPAVGLLELGAHAVQTHSVAPDRDWSDARAYVAAKAAAADLVAFAPRWADPIGREVFGADIATLEREARGDESRFPRAFEVSIRGKHIDALRGWRRVEDRHFGAVTVSTLENPAPAHVLDDLVTLVGAGRVRVSHGDRDCPWAHGAPQSGGLGFGPTVPGDRFNCPGGGFVGVSVVADLDYLPHRCVFAPPSGGAPLRLRFPGVHMGRALHGHHALYVEAEHVKGAPVTIAFSVEGKPIGTAIHRDMEGWKGFELDTSDFDKQEVDLVAEIASSGERRTYCFEADTR